MTQVGQRYASFEDLQKAVLSVFGLRLSSFPVEAETMMDRKEGMCVYIKDKANNTVATGFGKTSFLAATDALSGMWKTVGGEIATMSEQLRQLEQKRADIGLIVSRIP